MQTGRGTDDFRINQVAVNLLYENALLPIVRIDAGSVIDVRLPDDEKQDEPRAVTPAGTVYEVRSSAHGY